MNLEAKIERHYKKWLELSDLNASEKRDRKLMKACIKLENLFSSPKDFKAYWDSKWGSTIYIKR